MTIFALMAVNNPLAVRMALNSFYPNDFLEVVTGQWLIAARGVTAQQVSDRLALSPVGLNGNGLVVSMAGYYGFLGNNVWEWIATKVRTP